MTIGKFFDYLFVIVMVLSTLYLTVKVNEHEAEIRGLKQLTKE